MFPKEILWCVVITTAILVVTFADMRRKGNISRLIDITSKTSLALAFGARCLAAPMIFFKMKSIVVHNNFRNGFAAISVFSPFSFAGIDNFLHTETEKLNVLKVANGGYTLQFLFSICSIDVYDTFS